MELERITESEAALMDLVRHKRFLDLERIPLICNDIAAIRKMLEDQKEQYVTKDSFWPVKTLVYGFTGLLLVSVVGAIIALVLK